jgi:hypothetical protein
MRKIILSIIVIFIVIFIFLFYKQFQIETYENKKNNPKFPKRVWLLWFQGWENAPWLQKQVAKSWEIQNPDWKIEYLDENNLKNYIQDVNYIYDPNKQISPQAKSDIIRLSLLKNHGGVWADSTLLCMQPLNNWIYEKINFCGLWMYHGTGGDLKLNDKFIGPASWFIVSEKNVYIIDKWKEKCDEYWNHNHSTDNYFWMDRLFVELYKNDNYFKELWDKIPYKFCDDDGEAHTLNIYGAENNTAFIKKIIDNNPPYVLKLWNHFNNTCSDLNSEICRNSNGYYAIKVATKI